MLLAEEGVQIFAEDRDRGVMREKVCAIVWITVYFDLSWEDFFTCGHLVVYIVFRPRFAVPCIPA